MKIALLTNGLFPYVIGGMQKHTYYLAKYLAREGVHVDVYYAIPEEARSNEEAAALLAAEESPALRWFQVDRVPPARFPGHYIWDSYRNSAAIAAAVKGQEEVDFIYAQGFAGWHLLREKQRGAAWPLIGVNMHGLEMYQKPASARARIEQYMFRPFVRKNLLMADVALSLGGGLSRIMVSLGVSPERIVDSPNGVDAHWVAAGIPDRSAPLSFVFLGRYERRKGIEELHRAISRIDASRSFSFHFIGPIPDRVKLEDPRVTYWGLVKGEQQVKEILNKGDVLVCPSYSEGMPTVILEAMASGMAVIATNVGAVDALVSDQNGWLIPAGDSEALIEALLDAIALPASKLQEKKQRSHAFVQEGFLWNAVARKTIDGIEALRAAPPLLHNSSQDSGLKMQD